MHLNTPSHVFTPLYTHLLLALKHPLCNLKHPHVTVPASVSVSASVPVSVSVYISVSVSASVSESVPGRDMRPGASRGGPVQSPEDGGGEWEGVLVPMRSTEEHTPRLDRTKNREPLYSRGEKK